MDIRSLIRETVDVFLAKESATNSHLRPVQVGKYLLHVSNPLFRESIAKIGLLPKEKSETWLSDTKINGRVIFATNSPDENDAFDSTWDDDLYTIDTQGLSNKWFADPNFEYMGDENKHIITFDPIPASAIKLIRKGTGKSTF
jgi:hypothetical protein